MLTCIADVLDILHRRTGVNFATYRPAMLERRIASHFATSGATSSEDYLRQLQGSPAAAFRLLENITIKVSRFYRHAPTFDHLSAGLLEQLARERAGKALRIWCVGCGAGEEAYTLAMLLESAGVEGSSKRRTSIGTALSRAHLGVYPIKRQRSSYRLRFEPISRPGRGARPAGLPCSGQPSRPLSISHGTTSRRPRLRQEEQRYDLVSCRNVLIYLQPAAQVDATLRLLEATEDGGVLCLGEAEWPPPQFTAKLQPLPHKTRMFRVSTTPPFAADHELNRAALRSHGARMRRDRGTSTSGPCIASST